jgi:hypothetical protein
MDSFQDHLRICTKDQEIVTTKNRATLIAIKTILFVGVFTTYSGYLQSNQFRIGPIIFILFNLAVFNTIFFIAFFLLRFRYKETVFKIFFIINTVVLWHFNMGGLYYLIGLIFIDALLLGYPYLLRKQLPSGS